MGVVGGLAVTRPLLVRWRVLEDSTVFDGLPSSSWHGWGEHRVWGGCVAHGEGAGP